MAQDDPVGEFINLPHDQQMSTLGTLSPENQDKLLAEVKKRRSAAAPGSPWEQAWNSVKSAWQQQRLGKFSDEPSTVWEHAKNLVMGPLKAVTQPAQSPEESVASGLYGPVGLGYYRMFVEPSINALTEAQRLHAQGGPQASILSGSTYDPKTHERTPTAGSKIVEAIPIYGPWAAGAEQEAQTKGVRPAGAGLMTDVMLPELTGEALGGGKKFVGTVARRGLQTVGGWGPDLTRRAVETFNEKDLPAVEKHNLAEKQRFETDKTALENENAEKMGKYRQDIQKVKDEDRAAATQHQAEQDKAKQDLKALQDEHEQGKADVQANTELEKEVLTDLKALKETVWQKANGKYQALRAKMADAFLPREKAAAAVDEAYKFVRGSPDKIRQFKFISDMESHGEGPPPPLSWNDMQGYLEEFRKFKSADSDVRMAARSMEEFIEKEMGKLAEDRGLGNDWTDAQASWAKYKQTFYAKNSPVAQAFKADIGPQAARPFMGPQVLEQHWAIDNLRDYDPALMAKIERLRELNGKAKAAPGAPKPLANKPAPEPRDPEQVVASPKTKDLTDPKILKPLDLKEPEVIDVPGLKGKDIKSTARHFSLPKERDIHAGLKEIPGVFVRKWLAARLDRPGFVNWASNPSPGDMRFLEDLPEKYRIQARAKIQEYYDKQPAPVKLDPRLKLFLRSGIITASKQAGSQKPSDQEKESTAAAAERQAREAAQRLQSAP